MIEWMQKHKKYLVITIWVSGIAFVLAGFLGWGSYNFSNLISTKIAKVGNVYITLKDLQTKMVTTAMILGQRFNQEQIKSMGLEKKVMNDLIIEALLLNYARDLGLSASDEEIAKNIINNPSFNKNGQFDKNLYLKLVNNIGLNTEEYENNLKKIITINKLQNAIRLKPRNIDIELLASKNFMQDELEVKVLSQNDNNISINEKELLDFYNKHKNDYKSKKSFDINTYLVSLDKNQVDENEIKKFYDENKIRYKDLNGKILDLNKTKNKVIFDYKIKNAKAEALRKYLKLKKGEIQFNNKLNIDDKNSTFFALNNEVKEKQILKPIEIQNGFLIIQIDKINQPEILSFKDAKNSVIKDYKNSIAMKELKKLAKNELKNFKDAKNIGFVSRDTNTSLIPELTNDEFNSFLDQVFDKEYLDGYIPIGNKMIVYKVINQKLNDKEKMKQNYPYLKEASFEIINAVLNQDLISQLQKIYKIEFYKGKGIE